MEIPTHLDITHRNILLSLLAVVAFLDYRHLPSNLFRNGVLDEILEKLWMVRMKEVVLFKLFCGGYNFERNTFIGRSKSKVKSSPILYSSVSTQDVEGCVNVTTHFLETILRLSESWWWWEQCPVLDVSGRCVWSRMEMAPQVSLHTPSIDCQPWPALARADRDHDNWSRDTKLNKTVHYGHTDYNLQCLPRTIVLMGSMNLYLNQIITPILYLTTARK